MKIQIRYADKRGGHCKVLPQNSAEKLLDKLARRKICALIFSEDGKKIGEVAGKTWGYEL